MKLFIDTANVEEIRGCQLGRIVRSLTNPSLIAKEAGISVVRICTIVDGPKCRGDQHRCSGMVKEAELAVA